MGERILVFVPTYNERDNVESMVSGLAAQEIDADLLFLDDDSPDGTGAILDRLAASRPRLTVVHRKGARGVGSAHLHGIRWAYDRGYDLLVTMDCDFTHSPSDLGRLIAASATHDVAIGSRYLARGSLPGWNPLRRFLTHFGHFLTKRLLGMDYDATGAYRVYRLRRIPREVFDLVTSMGYAFFFESLFLLHRNGCSVGQVPIVLPARTYGHSKMSFLEPWRSLKQVGALSLAAAANPGQFRVGGEVEGLDPSLEDPQGWDPYWTRKRSKTGFAYEIVATIYRNLVIKRRLNAFARRHFPRGCRLLHAGCGSGQVDADLQDEMRITALDISIPALRLYRRNVPRAESVRHGSVLDLPFEEGSFDGAYNLGLVEHFPEEDVVQILREIRRVLKPGGKVVVFWPHARSTSVWFLGRVHWFLNEVLGRPTQLHPPEITHVRSKDHADRLARAAGLEIVEYRFGPSDGWVQAVVVARRPGAPAGTLA